MAWIEDDSWSVWVTSSKQRNMKWPGENGDGEEKIRDNYDGWVEVTLTYWSMILAMIVGVLIDDSGCVKIEFEVAGM